MTHEEILKAARERISAISRQIDDLSDERKAEYQKIRDVVFEQQRARHGKACGRCGKDVQKFSGMESCCYFVSIGPACSMCGNDEDSNPCKACGAVYYIT